MSLPKPPGVIRQFWARHPWWTDSIVAGICLVSLLPSLGSGFGAAAAPLALPLVTLGVGASTAAILFRRHFPWTVLAVVCGSVLVMALYSSAPGSLAIPLALYAVAVYRSNRDAWIGLAGSTAVATAASSLASAAFWAQSAGVSDGPSAAAGGIQLILMALVATLLGVNVGNRKRYLAALIDRAAQLVRERDQQAQLAAASERARIAREMHDIVSHSLTVMVSLANGSAATVHSAPEKSEAAMQQVAETGRHALTDMRRMLGVLDSSATEPGTDSAALSPQPTMDDIGSLVATFRSAGLPVRLSFSGVPPQDPGQQLTVYRIIQEGLTNALRYAVDATRVTAHVVLGEESIAVAIEDDGRASASGVVGAGRGVIGLQARVALYGGTVQSGPRDGGGWRLTAAFAPENGASPKEMDA